MGLGVETGFTRHLCQPGALAQSAAPGGADTASRRLERVLRWG